MDGAGNAYVVGTITSPTPVDFRTSALPAQAGELRSAGAGDLFVAKYDSSTQLVWAHAISDDDPVTAASSQANTRQGSGAAVSRDGTLAVIGTHTGQVTFGKDTITTAGAASFLAAVSAESGERLWARQVNLGSYGALKSVASNPHSVQNRFAVCGWATRAATGFVDGPAFGGLSDALVAVFDSQGKRVWAAQFGGRDTEGCNAVAVDDAGDVYASGWFDGDSLTIPGAPAVTIAGPASATRKFIWVAKFAGEGDGAGGAKVLRAVAYSGTFGFAAPKGMAATADGGLFVVGQFSGNLNIGGIVSSSGQDDGFVAKLDGKTLAPAWKAVRIGGEGVDQVGAVAATRSGDAFAVGTFRASNAQFRKGHGGMDTDGAGRFLGKSDSSMFLVRIKGASGATMEAKSFGGTGPQDGTAVAASRNAAGSVALLGSLSGSAGFGAAGEVKALDAQDVILVFNRAP
jgi:hypothetical protein